VRSSLHSSERSSLPGTAVARWLLCRQTRDAAGQVARRFKRSQAVLPACLCHRLSASSASALPDKPRGIQHLLAWQQTLPSRWPSPLVPSPALPSKMNPSTPTANHWPRGRRRGRCSGDNQRLEPSRVRVHAGRVNPWRIRPDEETWLSLEECTFPF